MGACLFRVETERLDFALAWLELDRLDFDVVTRFGWRKTQVDESSMHGERDCDFLPFGRGGPIESNAVLWREITLVFGAPGKAARTALFGANKQSDRGGTGEIEAVASEERARIGFAVFVGCDAERAVSYSNAAATGEPSLQRFAIRNGRFSLVAFLSRTCRFDRCLIEMRRIEVGVLCGYDSRQAGRRQTVAPDLQLFLQPRGNLGMLRDQVLRFTLECRGVEKVTLARAQADQLPGKLQYRCLRSPTPKKIIVRRRRIFSSEERHEVHAVEVFIVR